MGTAVEQQINHLPSSDGEFSLGARHPTNRLHLGVCTVTIVEHYYGCLAMAVAGRRLFGNSKIVTHGTKVMVNLHGIGWWTPRYMASKRRLTYEGVITLEKKL